MHFISLKNKNRYLEHYTDRNFKLNFVKLIPRWENSSELKVHIHHDLCYNDLFSRMYKFVISLDIVPVSSLIFVLCHACIRFHFFATYWICTIQLTGLNWLSKPLEITANQTQNVLHRLSRLNGTFE